MKKLVIVIVLTLLIVSSSCARQSGEIEYSEEEYQKTIAMLESELLSLKEKQSKKDAENEKKITELTLKLELLNAKGDGNQGDLDNTENKKSGFQYTVINNEATVTGYIGDDLEIVIPSSIDGYRVTAISDNAFEDSSLKSVVIPDGVKKIGWFAFYGCMELKTISIPSSVTEIGYSALGNPGSSLTIYCHSSSFALAFAKSFGLTYVIV